MPGEANLSIFVLVAKPPATPLFLHTAITFCLPPIILSAADGLGNAIHGLALGNSNILIGWTVLIGPGGKQQETIGNALLQADLRGMIDFREAIVCYQNDRMPLCNDIIDNILLTWGNAS